MNKRKTYLLLIPILLLLVVVALFFTRQSMVNKEIAEEWETFTADAPSLRTTSRLEIIPLYEEASQSPELISGHGVSYLIRTDAATILMDIGHNPNKMAIAPFAQNMQKLGIDWDEIDRILITHPHPDHMGGLTAWRQRTISFGELPGGLGERLVFVPSIVTNKGAVHATIPTLPSPDIATTGIISYTEVFPLSLRDPKGFEQALVVHIDGHGLVLITGCGHPTIERLVERAESLYGQPVVGVVGGFHYEDFTIDDVKPHIEFLRSHNPQLIAISPHDSSTEALNAFAHAFPQAYREITLGIPIQFPLIVEVE